MKKTKFDAKRQKLFKLHSKFFFLKKKVLREIEFKIHEDNKIKSKQSKSSKQKIDNLFYKKYFKIGDLKAHF